MTGTVTPFPMLKDTEDAPYCSTLETGFLYVTCSVAGSE